MQIHPVPDLPHCRVRSLPWYDGGVRAGLLPRRAARAGRPPRPQGGQEGARLRPASQSYHVLYILAFIVRLTVVQCRINDDIKVSMKKECNLHSRNKETYLNRSVCKWIAIYIVGIKKHT